MKKNKKENFNFVVSFVGDYSKYQKTTYNFTNISYTDRLFIRALLKYLNNTKGINNFKIMLFYSKETYQYKELIDKSLKSTQLKFLGIEHINLGNLFKDSPKTWTHIICNNINDCLQNVKQIPTYIDITHSIKPLSFMSYFILELLSLNNSIKIRSIYHASFDKSTGQGNVMDLTYGISLQELIKGITIFNETGFIDTLISAIKGTAEYITDPKIKHLIALSHAIKAYDLNNLPVKFYRAGQELRKLIQGNDILSIILESTLYKIDKLAYKDNKTFTLQLLRKEFEIIKFYSKVNPIMATIFLREFVVNFFLLLQSKKPIKDKDLLNREAREAITNTLYTYSKASGEIKNCLLKVFTKSVQSHELPDLIDIIDDFMELKNFRNSAAHCGFTTDSMAKDMGKIEKEVADILKHLDNSISILEESWAQKEI